jgi:hypothetical protein
MRPDQVHTPEVMQQQDAERTRKPTMGERFGAWVESNKANRPRWDAELFAIFREAVKDVRQTLMESYFGHGEHAPEAGTPLNPTQIMITDEVRGLNGGYTHHGPTYGIQAREAAQPLIQAGNEARELQQQDTIDRYTSAQPAARPSHNDMYFNDQGYDPSRGVRPGTPQDPDRGPER